MSNNEFAKKYCPNCGVWTHFISATGKSDEIVEECSKCGFERKQKLIGNLAVPMDVFESYLSWKTGKYLPDSKAMEDEFKRIDDEMKKNLNQR